MTDTKSFEELATRCEQATGPSRALEIDIFAAFTGLDPIISLGEKPFYTRSLDAALTLVPEGKTWMLQTRFATYHAEVDWNGFCDAKTPALALTAAALRARGAK